jgi:hypothetical protein
MSVRNDNDIGLSLIAEPLIFGVKRGEFGIMSNIALICMLIFNIYVTSESLKVHVFPCLCPCPSACPCSYPCSVSCPCYVWTRSNVDMLKCGLVSMCTCEHVNMWGCEHVDMRICGHVGMWSCRNVDMWTWSHGDRYKHAHMNRIFNSRFIHSCCRLLLYWNIQYTCKCQCYL